MKYLYEIAFMVFTFLVLSVTLIMSCFQDVEVVDRGGFNRYEDQGPPETVTGSYEIQMCSGIMR